MAFDITQFRAQMVGDGARANLFEVIMPFPAIARVQNSQQAGAADSKFTIFCRTSQLPGSTIGQIPLNYFGRELKFAGNRVVPEWTVTVYNDEDFLVRNSFEKWMNSINSMRLNLRSPIAVSPNSYTADPQVIQRGKDGDVLKVYKMIGVFPIDLSPIDVDWGANDTIEEFSVTFAVQWWEDDRGGII